MNKHKQPVLPWLPCLSTEVAAELATLGIFVLWGLNFSATKKCLEYTSPLVLNGLCFGTGGLVVLCIQYKQLRLCDWKAVVIVGFFMCVSSVLQTVALNFTLVAKTSFYSTLDIPITAGIEMFSRRLGWGEVFGERGERRDSLCAVLCCAMLCYAVLCCAMLCYAVLCHSMLYYATLCCESIIYS
jgi:hypothetical protein